MKFNKKLSILFTVLLFSFIKNSYGYLSPTKFDVDNAFVGFGVEVFHGDSYYTVNGKKEDIEFSLTERVINLEFATPVNKNIFVYYKLPLLWREMDLDIYSEVNGSYKLVRSSDYYRKGIGDAIFNFTYILGRLRTGTTVNIPIGNSSFSFPNIPLGLGRWDIYYFTGYVWGEKYKISGELSYCNRRSQKYGFIDPYGVYFNQVMDFNDRIYLNGGVSIPLQTNYFFIFNINYFHEVAKNKSNLLSGEIEVKYKTKSNEFFVIFNSQIYGKLYPDYPYLPQIFWAEGRPAGWSLIFQVRWFDNEFF